MSKTSTGSIIYNNLPEVGTPWGFVFYSLVCYCLVWFGTWLLRDPNNVSEESIRNEL